MANAQSQNSGVLPADPETAVAMLRAAPLATPGGLCVRLARAFGFCQGVRVAVERAMQAAGSPGSLYLTGEIIHNPAINASLAAAGVRRLPPQDSPDRLAGLRASDRVILPAFGIELAEEEALRLIGCRTIDTTCGWVRRVWRAVEEFSRRGLTIVIHGRREHEETRATASRARGPYVIVRQREEAGELAAMIRDPAAGRASAADGDALAQRFARAFSGRHSPAFDPRRDLARLGVVNQTTMLSSETEAVVSILRAALVERLGREPDHDEWRTLDTFCPATEERQSAVQELLADGGVDLVVVVGGWRSSNTAHLAALAARRVPTYHVEGADDILGAGEIRHLPLGGDTPIVSRGWLPPQPVTIGLTAGASTPDRETGRVALRLIEVSGTEAPEKRGCR